MPDQSSLANFDLGLSLLPDETIFSWCSRYHRQAANGLDRTTCMRLFDHPYLGSSHDFPARLGVLVDKSKGALGTASEIIFNRTVLPYYFPFRHVCLSTQAMSSLEIGGISHLKYNLGLITSGVGAGHPLKACPQCIQSDLDSHGWPYWRRAHQLPGNWVCGRHMTRLSKAHVKNFHRGRFSWILPLQADCRTPFNLSNDDVLPWLNQLTKLNMELIVSPPGSFCDESQIARAFRRKMASFGLISKAGRVHWMEMEPRLRDLAAHLLNLPELSHQSDPKLLKMQLLRLLAGRSLMHPLRYVVWISTFFSSLSDFREIYFESENSSLSQISNTSTLSHQPPSIDESKRKVLANIANGKISSREAAILLGVSHATISSWSALMNFQTKRRPKVIDQDKWETAVHMLKLGDEKNIVAEKIGISVVSVTRILRSTPQLQNAWHKARYEKRKLSARAEWTNSLSLLSSIGVIGMRALHSAAYAWFYRNDREWMKNSIAAGQGISMQNHSAQRMKNADQRLAEAIEKILSENLNSYQKFDLDNIQLLFPRIVQILKNPEKWPLTMRALSGVLGG